jgi:hypothetical protein
MPKQPWLKKRAAAARQRALELQNQSAQLRIEPDALIAPAHDARAGMTAPPRCPTCAHDETTSALRTEIVQYYRCPRCGYVWSQPHGDADSAPKTA